MDPETGPRLDTRHRVRDGDYVILQYGEGRYEKHRKILQVKSLQENCSDSTGVVHRAAQETLIRIGPRYVHPSVVIGLPWGVRLAHADSSESAPETTTEVDDNRFVLAVRTDSENAATAMDDSPSIRVDAAYGGFKNTPDIGDDRMNQTLSDAELAAYRERFRDQPQQYVSQLAEASKTFRKRTTFAQSKYLERKTSRHVFSMRLVRPTICTLTETLHHKMEGKSLWMHPEALGFVLHQAAIWAGSKRVLILEERSDRMGLVTAACAHRMCFPGRVPSNDEGILLFVAGAMHTSGIGPAMAMLGSGRKRKPKGTDTKGEISAVEVTTSNPIRSGSDGRSSETSGLPPVRLVPLECLVSMPNQQSSGYWRPLSA
ncbi:hypothetical protein F1559_005066 [Cyanidiococcus yangmingshanensis]|uniref:tRNA (adenine(58)-N(1))-methyltransferase non-catalytic subunit TRM6 n=1 Tax=Cyanidiococcus yangmingshanensis TaxID=2690220 RepID=A0A7J7ISD4_9RHOD|nr:hypothetical protein F1559_005066 [Cyanidiococcus yangmingshanensis]